jgi:putative oxidoreductase
MKNDNTSCPGLCGCVIRCAKFKICCANALYPLANIAMRLILAYVFFTSGVLKLPAGFLGIGQGDWESTIALFQTEYSIPLLSPAVAAYLSTAVEIIAPILLVLGLGTRVAAAAILVMAGMIEFTYQHQLEHVYWAVLSFVLLTSGGGRLSVDYYLAKACKLNASCSK